MLGCYCTTNGKTVQLASELRRAVESTHVFCPQELDKIVESIRPRQAYETSVSVVNCTTFSAIRHLKNLGIASPVCLNFASAMNPGGGFLAGSQAQEECLARASGLYVCLANQDRYYNANRKCKTALYTNHIIYSPDVPVFRDDNDRVLEEPFSTSIITSPAVNALAVQKNEPENSHKIIPTMKHRIESVLAVAAYRKHSAVVLGAWGCGVFGNTPAKIAYLFYRALASQEYSGRFSHVVFAILDNDVELSTLRPFQSQFHSPKD